MSDKLTITKEKVLAAASKCATAKATLEVLFPEVFEQDEKVEFQIFPDIKSISGDRLIENRRTSRNMVWLGDRFTWEIKEAETGGYELMPTRKN